jgi:hypothetical protein
MSPGPLALTSEIEALKVQFERIALEGDALAAPLRDDQFDWRPAPDAWSIAECFDHLNVTAREYLPKLDAAISDAIRRGLFAEGPFLPSLLGRIWVWTLEPPPRMRVKAPRLFHPASGRPRHEVMAALRAYQVQFVDRLRQANGLDLARAMVASPAADWIRLTLGDAFRVMAAHERRHLWQAQRITELGTFPK